MVKPLRKVFRQPSLERRCGTVPHTGAHLARSNLAIVETPTAVAITDDRGHSRTFHPNGKAEALQLGGFGGSLTMCTVGMRRLFTVVALAAGAATSVVAQEPDATTTQAAIEQAQAEKVKTLHPYVPGKAEALLIRAEDILVNGVPRWHPFFESAYYGGGFTLGVGYAHHVSPYNLLDVRGSYTVLG